MQHKKHWTIVITVLMILLVSTTLWILALQYVKWLVQLTNQFWDYHRAYYLARAWLEVQATKFLQHWRWFEDKIESTSPTFTQNFKCWRKACKWEAEIVATSQSIPENCASWVTLWKWEIYVLPLLTEKNPSKSEISIDNQITKTHLDIIAEKNNLSLQILSWNSLGLWLLIHTNDNDYIDPTIYKEYSWTDLQKDIISDFFQSLTIPHPDQNNFFVITNPSKIASVIFCINSKNNSNLSSDSVVKFTKNKVNFYGKWTVGKTSITLSTEQSIPFPSFLVNTFSQTE